LSPLADPTPLLSNSRAPGGIGMGIVLICLVVFFVLFAGWNKWRRGSLFWWRGKSGRDS
jgi:hypothetical protein